MSKLRDRQANEHTHTPTHLHTYTQKLGDDGRNRTLRLISWPHCAIIVADAVRP